ncbi:hypothetical protein SAMN04487866_1285 [Thermoactinomyces sp. DSM 45891]|uniref:hypothetical protein n=1 Tax=Thermoactinomyces sp. DSM 45891 TaxID=1761907 RepID=UPI00092100B3|nr:hypothetical protein [Thermoactinomyces sp. DSM 45891]SFX80672.1 hypothetical protein SAMN04487866_1285 [Thermoactinomyces sp. DSM 45891]
MRIPDRIMHMTDIFLVKAAETQMAMKAEYADDPNEELREALLALCKEVLEVMEFKGQDESLSELDRMALQIGKKGFMEELEELKAVPINQKRSKRSRRKKYKNLPDGVSVVEEDDPSGACFHFTHDELGYMGKIVLTPQEDGFELSAELTKETFNSIPIRHMMKEIAESMGHMFEESGIVQPE